MAWFNSWFWRLVFYWKQRTGWLDLGEIVTATGVVVDHVPPGPDGDRTFAVKLVKRFALWSGAGALIPVPFVDLAAVGGLQIQMLRRISQIYKIPFSKNAGKSLIASIAGTMIPATSGIGAASLFKSVPGVGTVVSGLAMPTLSAGATYAIGMTYIEHIVSGGTLLDFNLQSNREFFSKA